MRLDKQNRRHLPLGAIQQTGSQLTASRHCSLSIDQQGYEDPVVIPLPSLSSSCFLSLIWLRSLFFTPVLQMRNCTGMFSQAFSPLTTHTPSPSLSLLVPHHTKVLLLPQNQSLYRLDELVMSHLLISVQLVHLAQSLTAEMLHLKTCSRSFWRTASTLQPMWAVKTHFLPAFFFVKMSAFFRIDNFCLLKTS